MDAKTCGDCKILKPAMDFRTCHDKRSRKSYICSKCKECERKWSLARYHANKEICQQNNKEYKELTRIASRSIEKSILKEPKNMFKRDTKSIATRTGTR